MFGGHCGGCRIRSRLRFATARLDRLLNGGGVIAKGAPGGGKLASLYPLGQRLDLFIGEENFSTTITRIQEAALDIITPERRLASPKCFARILGGQEKLFDAFPGFRDRGARSCGGSGGEAP